MGEFKAGKKAIILLVYFFTFFLVLFSISSSAAHYNVTDTSRYTDTGFGSATIDDDLEENVTSTSDDVSYNSIGDAIGFAIGFNNSIQLGIPSEYLWIFRFFLVWLPGIYFLLCLYFMAPFLH